MSRLGRTVSTGFARRAVTSSHAAIERGQILIVVPSVSPGCSACGVLRPAASIAHAVKRVSTARPWRLPPPAPPRAHPPVPSGRTHCPPEAVTMAAGAASTPRGGGARGPSGAPRRAHAAHLLLLLLLPAAATAAPNVPDHPTVGGAVRALEVQHQTRAMPVPCLLFRRRFSHARPPQPPLSPSPFDLPFPLDAPFNGTNATNTSVNGTPRLCRSSHAPPARPRSRASASCWPAERGWTGTPLAPRSRRPAPPSRRAAACSCRA